MQSPGTPPIQPGFELFDHTADLGVRVWAPTRSGLLAPAVAGLYATIGELVPDSRLPRQPFSYDAAGEDAPVLLRDFLASLLARFERDGRLLVEPHSARLDSGRIALHGALAPLDEPRSALLREVKAVTYHELAIRPIPGGCQATFIVDI